MHNLRKRSKINIALKYCFYDSHNKKKTVKSLNCFNNFP